MDSADGGNARVITLTTDFGARDGYVGAMKGVIYGLQPAALIVDVTHEVSPQRIREGAFLLHTAYPSFPPGTIHVAVVDPGVGTARRGICLDVPGVGRFVGPDNGLFSYVLDAHPARRAREIANPAYLRHPVSSTFHGRDVFAPVAAHLSRGEPFEAVGPAGQPLAALGTGPGGLAVPARRGCPRRPLRQSHHQHPAQPVPHVRGGAVAGDAH